MSIAIMQGMACGIPIIASGVDGINNMIQENVTGLLVPVKNKEKLAESIDRLASDNSLADKLSKNALNFATANYSNLIMYNRCVKIFDIYK